MCIIINLYVHIYIYMDIGDMLVKATYDLEGDSLLAPFTYDVLIGIKDFFNVSLTQDYMGPKTQEYIQHLLDMRYIEQEDALRLLESAYNAVLPIGIYLNEKLFKDDAPLAPSMAFFSAARIVDPAFILQHARQFSEPTDGPALLSSFLDDLRLVKSQTARGLLQLQLAHYVRQAT